MLALLFFAGLIAGAMNAAAGGGSFVTFPALILAGVPPVPANASSTVALLPASVVSAWNLRSFIRPFPGISMALVIVLTLCGGFLGAWLLLHTPSANFTSLVPWLLLFGSLAFAFGRRAGEWLRRRVRIGPVFVLSGQFLLGVYGGYFGGAVGIMMLALWTLFGYTDIQFVNANKNLLVGIANSIAVVLFVAAGQIYWRETLVMMAGTIVGGYTGSFISKRIAPGRLRSVIVVLNFTITIAFFVKTYFLGR